MRYLLDSDAVIDYVRQIGPATDFLRELVRRGDDLGTCGVVVAEVYSGLLAEHAPRAEEFFESCLFFPSTLDSGRKAGEWRFTFARRGIALSTADTIIAAMAFVYGAALVTGNVSDFPMSELQVVELPRPSRRP